MDRLEALFKKAECGETFRIPADLMPDYIRYAYTKHPAVSRFFHIEVEEVSRGRITVGMDVVPAYTNSGGFLYGGILAAMADAMSLGLIVSVGKSAVTTNLSMNFVKTHPIGGRIQLHGTIRHNGRRMLSLHGEIRGNKGELLSDIEISMLVTGSLPEVPECW